MSPQPVGPGSSASEGHTQPRCHQPEGKQHFPAGRTLKNFLPFFRMRPTETRAQIKKREMWGPRKRHSLTGKSKGSPWRWQTKGLGTRERRPDGFLICLSTSKSRLKAGIGGGPSLSRAQMLFQVSDMTLFTHFSPPRPPGRILSSSHDKRNN